MKFNMNLNGKGIYIIENILNKDVYIGSTTSSFSQRFKEHMKGIRKGNHHSIILQNAFNKYGKDNFKFDILEYIDCPIECRNVERTWINIILPKYNMTHEVSKAIVYTPEISRKMSEAHGGKPFEMYKNDTLIGVFYSQATCSREYNLQQSKIGEVLKGNRETTGGYRFKTVNEDFKYKKLPRKVADLSNRVWKKHTDETKIKIGIAGRGRIVSDITKEKISRIKLENLASGKNKMPDFSNKQVRINLARSLFNGILKVYYNDIYVGSYYSTLEAAEDLKLKACSIAACIHGNRNSLYNYKFKKESINA